MRRVGVLVFSAAFLACGGILAAEAGTVKGTFTINGKAYTPKHVYAVAKPDAFDQKQEGIELLFALQPVDEKELASAIPGSGPRLTATLGADGSLYGIAMLYDGGSFSTSGSEQVFEKKAMDASRVAGRLHSKKEIEMSAGKGGFDLTFDAPVFREKKAPPPSAAEKTSAAKSPQAKAYESYLRAVRSGDLAALKKCVTKDIAQMLEDPEAKERIEMVKSITPAKVEYLRVKESGDAATLEAQSEDGKGTIECAREGGAWKIGQQRWSGGS